MKLAWHPEAWAGYTSLQTDRKMLKRANKLLEDIMRHPREGIGKPEPLRGDLSGLWSRRIDLKNRIIYSIDDAAQEVVILDCGGHYGDC